MITYKDVDNILEKNMREIPYEGLEIDKYAIIEELLELVNKPVTTTNEQPKYFCTNCGNEISRIDYPCDECGYDQGY